MITKVIQLIPALFILASISFRYFSLWCIDSISSCHGSWINQEYQYFTGPLYSFSLFLLPLVIILIFVPRNIFNTWLKFTVWMILLSILHIALTPVSSTGWMNFFPYYRDDAARYTSIIFLVVSLTLILPRLILTKIYTWSNQDFTLEGLESHLKSWYILLSSVGGFACTLVFLGLAFTMNSLMWLGTISTLVAATFIFNTYVSWNLYTATQEENIDGTNKFLWRTGLTGYVGLIGIILFFALSLFSGLFYYPEVLIYTVLACVIIGPLALFVRAIRVFSIKNITDESWKLTLVSLILASSMVALILVWFLP